MACRLGWKTLLISGGRELIEEIKMRLYENYSRWVSLGEATDQLVTDGLFNHSLLDCLWLRFTLFATISGSNLPWYVA